MSDKSNKIKATINATKSRRKIKRCRTISLKIQANKLNLIQSNHLFMLFVEAKWLYNHILSDIKQFSSESYLKSLTHIPVKYQDNTINQPINFLSSQMKQAIATQLKSNLSALSALKKKGFKVGKLKFKKSLNSINLKQYLITHRFYFNSNRLSIQGMKKSMKINGLDQLKTLASKFPDLEIANAKLLKVDQDYFLNLTLYHTDSDKLDEVLGIDFGISEQLTLSSCLGFKYQIKESKQIKKLQRRLARKYGNKKKNNKSKNFYKTLKKLRKEHRKVSNKRRNINNQIFGFIDRYKYIAIQDEMIKSWYTNKIFGKKIQYTGIGAIKAKIKNLGSTRVSVIDKKEATTKECFKCGNRKEITLNERKYKCDNCGINIKRDINSSFNMIKLSKFSPEQRKAMPLDGNSTILKNLRAIDGLSVRVHQLNEEALRFIYE